AAKDFPRGPDYFVFVQEKSGTLRLTYAANAFIVKHHSLQGLLQETIGLKRYELEGPNDLRDLNLPADWTVREGADRETFLAALEPILASATGRNIHFEKRTVEREVIVAHGRSDGESLKTVHIYTENSKDPSEDQGMGNLDDLLG